MALSQLMQVAQKCQRFWDDDMHEAKSWPGLSTRGRKKSNEIASPINER
jgi:hypothetical protein